MAKKYKQFPACLSVICLLISCTRLREPTASTAMSTQVNMPGNFTQITDGKLKLTIKELNGKCYHAGDLVPLTITYENLTDKPLIVADYSTVDSHVLYRTQGQLFPALTAADGTQIVTPYDLMRVDAFNLNSPLLHEVPARSVFEVSLEHYYFPTEFVQINAQGQGPNRQIPAGQYRLKFVFIGNSTHEPEWEGTISSNQVEICVVN
jgi:hypothetical protein